MIRCPWCESSDLYRKYHDEEWGKPVYDDRTHFEFLVLESAQSGLSWITLNEVPAKTELSDTIAKDLKKRGFKFLGSTTIYSYLQAVGIVNDHLVECEFRD